MRILIIDKYHFVLGGAERYMFELAAMLEQQGHQVAPFAMAHPRNLPSPYSSFFPDNVEYESPSGGTRGILETVRSFSRMVYSRHCRRRIERLVDAFRPDVAHVHMVEHQLSPSVLAGLVKKGVPALQTVHQYKLVCPNYKLYNPRTNRVCEKCLHGSTWHPVFERCHKDSLAASLAIAFESSIHRLLRLYEKNLKLFHTPSRFMQKKLIEGGVDPAKVRQRFYSVRVGSYRPVYSPGSYVLYFGRLSHEKGLATLLQAAALQPRIPFRLVGEGPLRARLEQLIAAQDLSNVELVGRKDGENLAAEVQGAYLVVVPSEWYENSPLVVYEALCWGKPVLGSRIGGIPELIEEGGDGLLFEPGDAHDLASKLSELWQDPGRVEAMGRQGRRRAEIEFDEKAHYETIRSWYEEIRRVA